MKYNNGRKTYLHEDKVLAFLTAVFDENLNVTRETQNPRMFGFTEDFIKDSLKNNTITLPHITEDNLHNILWFINMWLGENAKHIYSRFLKKEDTIENVWHLILALSKHLSSDLLSNHHVLFYLLYPSIHFLKTALANEATITNHLWDWWYEGIIKVKDCLMSWIWSWFIPQELLTEFFWLVEKLEKKIQYYEKRKYDIQKNLQDSLKGISGKKK